ncbi:MAG: hypothetical protein JWQ02_2675 [Capsulimonas sp.]|nr:hypothetical protein [Capsulimonas sp.]
MSRNHTAVSRLTHISGLVLGLGALISLTALPARAHFFWASITPDPQPAFHLTFGEDSSEPISEKLMDHAKTAQAWTAAGDLKLEPKDSFLTSVLPAGAKAVAAGCTWGIVPPREPGKTAFFLEYYAKAVTDFSGASETVNLPLELFARRDGAAIILTVKENNQPAVKSDIVVQVPNSNEDVKLTTDGKGEARFTPAKSGSYNVRALVEHQRSGAHNGKPYSLVKEYTTIVLPIAAP